jgi:hypothetical protein
VEERAGVAEQDRPRMDPPNVFWFFGAFVIAFGVYALIEAIPKSQDGVWRLVTAVGFFAAFAVLAAGLLRGRWWVPGGLAAALAVATFPAVAVGFLQLLDLWPNESFFRPFTDFNGYWFGVALATAAVGLGAFAVTRFTFIIGLSIAIVVLASQLFVPCFVEGPSGDDRSTMALVVGAGLVIVGIFLDVFGRRREAFWFHVFGWLTAAGGLIWFTVDSGGNPDRGWIPMLVVGLALVISAARVRRATWAVYGVFGFYAAVVHYLAKGLDRDHWPFALLLLALGLSIYVFGMVAHRYGRAWAGRFVRRPPPSLGV